MTVYTGGSASVFYGYETTFGTTPAGSAIAYPFGLNQKVTNFSVSNTRLNFNKLGQVETAEFAYGQQAGQLGIGFVFDDTQASLLFASIYGTIATGGKYPLNKDQGSGTTTQVGRTLTTEIAVQTGTSVSKLRQLSGCVVNSLSLSTSIGEPVNGNIDMTFGKEVSSTLGADNNGAIDSQTSDLQAGKPYTFAHGTFKVSNGSSMVSIGEVQSADVNWTQNSELLYGLGSHYAQGAFKKTLDISGKFKTSFKNDTMATHVLDQAKSSSNTVTLPDTGMGVGIELLFTNGTKSMKIELHDVAIGDYSVSGIEPVEPIFEDISWKAKTALITIV